MSKNPLCLFVCAVFMLVAILLATAAPGLAVSDNPPGNTDMQVRNNMFLPFAPELSDMHYMGVEMGETTPPFGDSFEDGYGSQPPPQVQMNQIPQKDSPDVEKHNKELANATSQTQGNNGNPARNFFGAIFSPIVWWFGRPQELVEPIRGQDGRQAYNAWFAGDVNGESADAGGYAYTHSEGRNVERETEQDPRTQHANSKTNDMAKGGSSGSAAGEDSSFNLDADLEMCSNYLHNVANEATGVPCSSRQPVKSYNNAIWMMQQMYKQCYIPMAVLFLLPGALITNAKAMVSFGILNVKDEDTVNPFSGIMRSVIAIFLIPATQLFVSYVIDTANALTYPVAQEVNIPLILFWAFEQIQAFDPDQQGNLIKDLPMAANVPYRGKFASMPTSGGILEQMSGCDITLLQCFNEIMHLMTEGLSIISAFQLVFMCYLFLLGPIAAAFFAWPAGVGRDLFRKAFATWMDGVVILALWKFWWNIVLLCITVRLESEGINIFDITEVYFCIAFMSMLLFVPFNPFDFKAGEIVSHLLEKAQQQAGKVASGGGGKGGGSAGGGNAGGQGARGPTPQK